MTTPGPADRTSADWRSLFAAGSAITVFGLAFGMTFPLLSLILESRGVSADMIGANAAMMPLGVLLFSMVIPRLARRHGGRRIAVIAAALTAAAVLAYKVFDNLPAWFVIRLLHGMASCVLFVLSEAWIVRFAPARFRARAVAVYGSVLAASFAAGPAVIAWIGITGWLPFLLPAAVLLAGIGPLALVRDAAPVASGTGTASGVAGFATKAPLLLAAVGVFAVFDAATLSLLPVWGLRAGLEVSVAAGAVSALILGSVVLEFPIGWLADHYPRPRVLAACGLATALLLSLLPLTAGSPWMWPNLVLAGAVGYGVYTVALADLGDRFSGAELVAGSSAFATTWGLGAMLGSLAGGWSMAAFGAHGLPGMLSAVYLLLAIAVTLQASGSRAGRL